MRSGTRGVVVVLGVVGLTLSGCTGGSSGGGSGSVGPASKGPGGASRADGSTSCSSNSFDFEVETIARVADRVGIGKQATPTDALRATLTRGREPYFGGNGGTGLVGLGFPRTGWREVSVGADKATFRASVPHGTAQLTYTRSAGRWLVSHGETGGAGC